MKIKRKRHKKACNKKGFGIPELKNGVTDYDGINPS